MKRHNRNRMILLSGESSRQGGAVIIVVLSLLTTLTFLGLFFYNWTSQDVANAQLFSASDSLGVTLNPEAVFDDALRQVLVSVPADRPDSALYAEDGSGVPVTLWSMLAHEVGPVYANTTPYDGQALNGTGITVNFADSSPNDGTPDLQIDTDGDSTDDYTGFYFDYNGDGTNDANYSNFPLNFSAAANGGVPIGRNGSTAQYIFYPDAGYTYADINSLFLAMDYTYVDPQDTTGASSVRIVKPSFALPGYFPYQRKNGFDLQYTTGNPTSVNANQSMRPHRGHGYIISSTLQPRYLPSATMAQSGDTTRLIQPYDFSGGTWGAWEGAAGYNFDRDLDGDGTDDSIDIDLGHPIVDLPEGRQVVPIFQFKIEDLDALLNANVHGQIPVVQQNSNIGSADMFTQVFGSSTWVHKSHMGLSPAEVNPEFALWANPNQNLHIDNNPQARIYATAPLRGYFAQRWTTANAPQTPSDRTGGPLSINRLQTANAELAMLLYGRPDIVTDDPVNNTSYLYFGNVDFVGRYGVDGGTLRNGLTKGGIIANEGRFAAPGHISADDDSNDSNIGNDLNPTGANYTNGLGGLSYRDPRLNLGSGADLAVPPFMHPLDYSGLGDLPTADTANAAIYRRGTPGTGNQETGQRLLGGLGTSSPVRFPGYPTNGTWQQQGKSGTTVRGSITPPPLKNADLGYRTLQDAGGSVLQPNSSDLLLNNANETQFFSDSFYTYDAAFPPSEIAALHLTDGDWDKLGLASRLRNLLPINFEFSKQSPRIRDQFTTESWDRLDVAFSPYPHGTNRQWEFSDNEDLDSDGTLDTGEDENNNGIIDGYRFPPKFGVAASRHERTNATSQTQIDNTYTASVISDTDPFRPEVRRLLTIMADSNAESPNRGARPQQRLQLNRILSDDAMAVEAATQPSSLAAFDSYGNPQFRNLVPHVVDDSLPAGSLSPMVHDNLTEATADGLGGAHPYNRFDEIGTASDTNGYVQEWWARYDRQRLARDIYVLLYTLSAHDGSSVDGTDLTTTAPSAAIARDMAQFAVNVVDAMDRDDCITKFEYDENLSDGWSSSPSQVVYGTEAQQLAFHESLLIRVLKQSTDSTSTLFDESADDHRFLYLELRNASPFDVELHDGSWRIVRIDPTNEQEQVRAEFIANSNGTSRSIPAGENYIIACHDGTVTNGAGQAIGSEFFVDYANDPELECAIPKGVTTTFPDNNSGTYTSATNDIDLDMTAKNNGITSDDNFVKFTAVNGYMASTRLVEPTPGGGGSDVAVAFSLQRRLNTHANGMTDDWVEVDRLQIAATDIHQFSPGTDSQADNQSALTNIDSDERLHHFTALEFSNPGTGQQNHSMDMNPSNKHNLNDYTIATPPSTMDGTTEVPVWQPHFDRDFTSVIDLLSIPLYGPRASGETNPFDDNGAPYTANGRLDGGVVYNLTNASIGGNADASMRLAGQNTAQVRFLFPDPGQIPGGHPWNGNVPNQYVNRWFRLLGFVDVPTSADDAIESRLQFVRRTPGKINLNTVRHEHVLAGLVDDDIHLDGISSTAYVTHPTNDKQDADRSWYTELLFDRDQTDAFSANLGATYGLGTPLGLPLPGIPVSKPFRPFGRIDRFQPNDSVASTLLRLGIDTQGTANELTSMGLFEARPTADFGANPEDQVVDYHTRNRILAKVANNSTERSHLYAMWVGYELHEAHINATTGLVQIGAKAEDLPSYRMFCVVDMSRLEEAYDPNTNTFDFRKFIIHRQLLP